MIKRHYSKRLNQLLNDFPIVCLLGPRQCGKTTFIKNSLPNWTYLDLEKPSDLIQISGDPENALKRLNKHFILDEAQQLPSLFPILRGFIDEQRNQNGRIVLLGSASPTLIKNISESLAGRIGFLDMSPLHWEEISKIKQHANLENLWFRGGFPDVFIKTSQQSRLDWFDAYTRTFIQRDLTALGINISPAQMQKLWAMLAHFNGNIWNASKLASSMGVSYHTINHYTDILEQTFLIRKLSPFYSNIGKRLIKRPKIYFRDSGLLHYFLDIHDEKTLAIHPNRGASWEGFIIEQIINALIITQPTAKCYYWRTASGVEVDLLIAKGQELIPIEIKLHSAPNKEDIKYLGLCMQDLNLKKGYVIYPGKTNYFLGNGIEALSAANLLNNFERIGEL